MTKMTIQILCVLTTVVVLWLIAEKKRSGFAIGMVGQIVWTGFFIETCSYFMLVTCVIYFALYWRGWVRWRLNEAN